MVTAGEIYNYIDSFAPFSSAMDFDNPGLLVGSEKAEIKTALLSLDITPGVVHEAESLGARLIISHHPVIFDPLKTLKPGTSPYLLAQTGIAAICAHTNLDMAPGGVNACLANRLNLKNIKILKEYKDSGLPEALYGETEREYTPTGLQNLLSKRLTAVGFAIQTETALLQKSGFAAAAEQI